MFSLKYKVIIFELSLKPNFSGHIGLALNTIKKSNNITITRIGALVAQWVKRWPTDLMDQVQSPPEAKSS